MMDLLKRYHKLPRWGVWGGGVLVSLLALWGWDMWMSAPPPPTRPRPPLMTPSTPAQVLPTKELWVHRMEGKAEDMHKDVDDIRSQHQALKHQLDMMSDMMATLAHQQAERGLPSDPPTTLAPPSLEERLVPPSPAFTILSLPQDARPLAPPSIKSVEELIPAGTYAAGILTSGIAASTALNAQSDPQPVMVRLTSPGKLPRGFKADIHDAVIIAACYGDLSSERANCRLTTLLLIEQNGEVLSKKVEGWIIGDDGIPGIKGRVVDKAGDVVRGSFWAGLLGGIASYFRATAQQPPFTLTSAGAAETKQMAQSEMAKSAGASGASNALERLADFALKRAEQMQPVIMVHPGRAVDVVFKEDVDLSNSTLRQGLVLKAHPERQAYAPMDVAPKHINSKEDF